MNWILVVLQATSAVGTNSYSHYYNGWHTIGEFRTEKDCVAASAQLAKATAGVHGVKNFQCLNKGDNK